MKKGHRSRLFVVERLIAHKVSSLALYILLWMKDFSRKWVLMKFCLFTDHLRLDEDGHFIP